MIAINVNLDAVVRNKLDATVLSLQVSHSQGKRCIKELSIKGPSHVRWYWARLKLIQTCRQRCILVQPLWLAYMNWHVSP